MRECPKPALSDQGRQVLLSLLHGRLQRLHLSVPLSESSQKEESLCLRLPTPLKDREGHGSASERVGNVAGQLERFF